MADRRAPCALRAALLLAALAPAAANLFGYGTAAAQDPLPPCDVQVLCNGEFCADVCRDGTVTWDPWLVSAIRFQYNLTRARSLRWGPTIGTHNGFISRTLGMGLTEDLASSLYARTANNTAATHVRVPNQRYGPKSLLDGGVRSLELDIWEWLVNNDEIAVVVCHSPVQELQATLDLQAAANKLGLGNLAYSPFTELCSNLTVAWALTQVREWLAENADEVVEIYLDNRVPSWDVDKVTDALVAVFNDSILTPPLLRSRYAGVFPSRDDMIRDGLRVYAVSDDYGNNYSGTRFPSVVFWPTLWSEAIGATDLAPFPNCTWKNHPGVYHNASRWPRLLDPGDLVWDPESTNLEQGIVLKPVGVADLAACATTNIGLADVTEESLRGWVWSWAAGEPRVLGGGCTGAAMALVRGQWRALRCETAMPALCRHGDNREPAGDREDLWRVTNTTTSFAGAPAACAALGAGWAFDMPREGRENALVAQHLLFDGFWRRGGVGVWLNWRSE